MIIATAPTAETVAWDQATSEVEGVAAWQRDSDLVLASTGMELLDAVPALGALGPAYGALFMSTVGLYLWETAGAAGRRQWHWSEGECILDEGTPHPAESGTHELTEDSLFVLLSSVGGFTYDERLESAGFTLRDAEVPSYDYDDDAWDAGQDAARGAPAPAPPKRRKRFGIF